jgi:hypothetical protein
MTKSDFRFIFLAIFFAAAAACSGSSVKGKPAEGVVVTYTTIDMAADINTNDYKKLTAKKTVYDTVRLVTIDSSGGKTVQEKRRVRDSSYMVWYLVPVFDSTGKQLLRNSANTGDSMRYDFIPMDRDLMLKDYMKNWPVKN